MTERVAVEGTTRSMERGGTDRGLEPASGITVFQDRVELF